MKREVTEAARILRSGGVVAFPTETVYGLGADARNEQAIARVFEIKGRPADHPLIVHIADVSELDGFAEDIPEAARTLGERFWPGPLTLILRRRGDVPPLVTGGQATIGLRVPDHPVALELLRVFGGGLAAPSANRYGRVSPTRAEHVVAELGESVDAILDGGGCQVGIESTIVDLSGDRPAILRVGGIERSAIEQALGMSVPLALDSSVRAPGTVASHYAPRARVELVAEEAQEARAAELLSEKVRVVMLRAEPANGLDWIALPREPAARARRLYAALREVDERGFEVALVDAMFGAGELAEAVADRVQRAAAPRPEPVTLDSPARSRTADASQVSTAARQEAPVDPRARFSETVEDYARYRPDYPDALFDWIMEEADLRPGDTVVDVGSGTGISARQLAARGLRVIGVEPNAAMLAEATAAGGGITYVSGDAETLPIGATSVDAIVGGQAFHWFDLDRALPRFRELLRPGGRVVAFFNLRDDSDPLMAAYGALLHACSPEYEEVGAEAGAEAVAAHPGLRDVHRAELPHAQMLDRAGFHGRVWSSSYVRRSITDREAFDRALDRLFDEHARGGRVRFVYRTVALGFR